MTVTFIVTSVVTCIVTSQHIQVTIFIPLFMRHDEDLVRYGGGSPTLSFEN